MTTPIIIKKNQLVLFDPPLGLRGAVWVQLPGPADKKVTFSNAFFSETIKVQVPDHTKFIHASLASSNLAFNSFDSGVPSKVAAIRSDIKIKFKSDGVLDIDVKGFCTIEFTAVLQDAPLVQDTGEWTGWFLLEIICFG